MFTLQRILGLLATLCCVSILTTANTVARWTLQTTGSNVLIKDAVTGEYLNMYFKAPNATLHTGTGDASQWKVLRESDKTAVTTPEENVDYLLQTQMNVSLNQYAYVTTEKCIQTKADADAGSIFRFKAAPEGGFYLYHVATDSYIQQGAHHVNLTMGALSAETPKDEATKAGIYTIEWKTGTGSYITEEADGSMVISNYDETKRMFWEFVTTDKPNCFYLRNTATGRYIQSCNLEPSSASRVNTGKEPVEYYVAKNTTAGVATFGQYWFSSTDCANYDKTASSPRALNKDGASNFIITWTAANGNVGSFWTLHETEDLYDLRPFMVGESYRYLLQNDELKALQQADDNTLSWEKRTEDLSQAWYFKGESNRAGGYQIINAKTGKALNDGTAYVVVQDLTAESAVYQFRPFATKDDATTDLTIDGKSAFTFRAVRSAFSRNAQIYQMPCGALAGLYISELSLTGEAAYKPLVFPITTAAGKESATPAEWFTLYVRDKAEVQPGKSLTLDITMNQTPAAGYEAFAYFDWNRDGVFEAVTTLDVARTMSATIPVPADAKEGKTRMRIRITDNGLTDAEDEAVGQIFDAILTVIPADKGLSFSVTTSDLTRGTVSYELNGDEITIKAEPLGNSKFIAWREGNRLFTTTATHTFTLDRSIHLTVYFTPNTDIVTLIEGVEVKVPANNVFYDLQGRQVLVPRKGIYILNGKKVLVK
ncbi:MAG: hypothetical protein J6S02_03840 [Bacteroidaceae bacterium]|nr:hypothetical protein [Bacteroidaceae bacterium]